jgi:hypothetical protein
MRLMSGSCSLYSDQASAIKFFSAYSKQLYAQHDRRTPIEKARDMALSILREIGYGFSLLYRCCFPAFDFCGKTVIWKKESGGLCVLLHGLNGHPSIWNPQRELLKKHSKLDVFVPAIPKKGNCSLEEAAEPILSTVLDYVAKKPGKPICLLGISNGSRLATWLEVQLREKAPTVPVKVSTIAGVHFGSAMMDRLQRLGIAQYLYHPSACQELVYGSSKSRELLSRVVEPLSRNVADRSYEFYASTDDFHVPDIASSLPYLNKGERLHILHGYDHSGIVSAVAEKQIASCTHWIKEGSGTHTHPIP